MSQLLLRPVQELSRFAMASGPDATADLVCVLDALPHATALLHPEVETRWAELHEQVLDAHAATTRARQAGADGPGYVPPPSRLFMTPEELAAGLARLAIGPADRLGQAHPCRPSRARLPWPRRSGQPLARGAWWWGPGQEPTASARPWPGARA